MFCDWAPDIRWSSSCSSNLQTCIYCLSTCVAWNSRDKLVMTMNSFSRRCINCAIWISFPRRLVQMLTFGVCTFVNLSFQWAEFNGSLRTVNCGTVEEQISAQTASYSAIYWQSWWLHQGEQLEAIIHEGFIVYWSRLEFDVLLCTALCCSTFTTCTYWWG